MCHIPCRKTGPHWQHLNASLPQNTRPCTADSLPLYNITSWSSHTEDCIHCVQKHCHCSIGTELRTDLFHQHTHLVCHHHDLTLTALLSHENTIHTTSQSTSAGDSINSGSRVMLVFVLRNKSTSYYAAWVRTLGALSPQTNLERCCQLMKRLLQFSGVHTLIITRHFTERDYRMSFLLWDRDADDTDVFPHSLHVCGIMLQMIICGVCCLTVPALRQLRDHRHHLHSLVTSLLSHSGMYLGLGALLWNIARTS